MSRFARAPEIWPQDARCRTLAQVLGLYTVPQLSVLQAVAPAPDTGTTKAARIASLCGAMTGDSLRSVWERLSEPQKAAVSMAVYARDGHFDARAFKKRHGAAPDFGEVHLGFSALANPTRLCLFIHGEHVPTDLRRELMTFVPKPPAVELPSSEQAPETAEVLVERSGNKPTRTRVVVAETEAAALAELREVLEVVGTGRVRLTGSGGQASAEGLRAIGAVLAAPDFFKLLEKKGARPVRPLAWATLLVGAGLACPRQGRLALTARGSAALRRPPAEVVREVWRAWCTEAQFDELERLEGIRGRGALSPPIVPPFVRRALVSDALRMAPVGRWVRVDDFFDAFREAGLDFRVIDEPWRLSIEGFDDIPLDCLRDHDRWLVLQGRNILVMLFEHLATLGLVDLAFTAPDGARAEVPQDAERSFLSRYDGLRAFRLTPLGAWCLGMVADYAREPAPQAARMRLEPGLVLVIDGEPSRAERTMFEAWCQESPAGRWQLDRQRILESLAGGQRLDDLRSFLAARLGGTLPAEISRFLDDCEERSRACSALGAAVLLECASEEVAALAVQDPRTRGLCVPAGPRRLVVLQDRLRAFRKALRAIGYDLADPAESPPVLAERGKLRRLGKMR